MFLYVYRLVMSNRYDRLVHLLWEDLARICNLRSLGCQLSVRSWNWSVCVRFVVAFMECLTYTNYGKVVVFQLTVQRVHHSGKGVLPQNSSNLVSEVAEKVRARSRPRYDLLAPAGSHLLLDTTPRNAIVWIHLFD